MHAAVAEVPVRQPLQPVRVQQRLEVAQVGAEPLDWDGGVLPARVCEAAVDVRAASPAPSSRIRQSAAASATSVTTSEFRAPASARTPWALALTSATLSPVSSTISQPSPRGQLGDDRGRDVAQPLHDAGVHALDGGGECGRGRGGVGGVGHRG